MKYERHYRHIMLRDMHEIAAGVRNGLIETISNKFQCYVETTLG